VEALQKLCHDAMVAAVGGVPRFFPADAVPQLAAHAALAALSSWQRSLQRVRRHADHPWSEPLLVESLVAEGRAALSPPAPTARGRSAESALDTLD
jgi:DNA polymerase III subunit delta'